MIFVLQIFCDGLSGATLANQRWTWSPEYGFCDKPLGEKGPQRTEGMTSIKDFLFESSLPCLEPKRKLIFEFAYCVVEKFYESLS